MSADADAMAAVDLASWPVGLATNADQFRQRIAAFPEGQWVAELDGRVVGCVAAQRITEAWLSTSPVTFDRITDHGTFSHSHDPQGEIFQLIGVGVMNVGRGLRLGRRLVDREIELARSLPGIQRIVGFTRPAGFARYPQLSIDEYLSQRKSGDRSIDPVVAFHLDASARIVSLHPDFRPADTEARAYGILIEYPLTAPTNPTR